VVNNSTDGFSAISANWNWKWNCIKGKTEKNWNRHFKCYGQSAVSTASCFTFSSRDVLDSIQYSKWIEYILVNSAALVSDGGVSEWVECVVKTMRLWDCENSETCKHWCDCTELSWSIAVSDGTLRPLCRHLANSTKHKHRLPFHLLCQNMTSSTKPEVHDVVYCWRSHGHR